MARVVVASNRGPLSFERRDDGSLAGRRGGGGLVSALSSLSADSDATWVCAAMSDADRAAAAADVLDYEIPLRMLDIPADVFSDAYDGVANSTLWFVSHLLYPLATEPVFDDAFAARWEHFREYNAAFAAGIAAVADQGAAVLIQDYHLSLAPALLRELRPDLRIAHFSHTPWAPPEYFRVLPTAVARELLLGILGADHAGFLSPRWAAAFAACCSDVLGHERDGRVVRGDGRDTVLGVHALGVDAPAFTARGAEPDVPDLALPDDLAIVARVDRTELSKNIVRGFQAIAELLRREPAWRERLLHVAIAYPSRGGLPAYSTYMDDVRTTAAAVNAELGTPGWQPIQLIVADDYPQSLALLRRSDVLLINPIRDGMNLVAKEGPLLSERDAVLVLSTLAGAADEMSEGALLVNPFDVGDTASALSQALRMGSEERARRAAANRRVAGALPPQAWLAQQLDALLALP